MWCIGNDIVDINDPDTPDRSNNHRFCNKVFNEEEISHITTAKNPHHTLWSCWAIKEASYKAIQQLKPSLSFNPKLFSICFKASKVLFDKYYIKYRVRYDSLNNYIHAIAIFDDLRVRCLRFSFVSVDRIDKVQKMIKLYSEQEEAIPNIQEQISSFYLRKKLAHAFGYSLQNIHIKKECRIPYALCGQKLLDVALSLSHHGRYIGCFIVRYGNYSI